MRSSLREAVEYGDEHEYGDGDGDEHEHGCETQSRHR